MEDASLSWRELWVETTARLGDPMEARWVCEHASGLYGLQWVLGLDSLAGERAVFRLDSMVGRRPPGEPLQYVLGSWSFRGLDLMVDRRVLIPRPETEQVVEVALEEAERHGLRRARKRRLALVDAEPELVVADLGTGSGAIALALDAELPDVLVWATDVSEDALAVARANIAGCAAARVRTALGSWFDALPAELRGRLELIVSNPPYVAEHEVAELPAEVAGYEPRGALVSGATGRESIEHLVAHARDWLAPGASFVCEIAPHQAAPLMERARAAGYTEALGGADLGGRRRVLVARTG